jgi:pilus assembly protein CpaB
MNTRRIMVLVLAAVAAGGIALLMRSFLGGGVQKAAAAPSVPMTDVLVAARDIKPGEALSAAMVQWQHWPKAGVSGSFITGEGKQTPAQAVEGAVARSPMVNGEPVTADKIVRTGATGFLAATLTPGMRAVSISVTLASVAGGFIQPGNHVDVLLLQGSGGTGTAARSGIVLADVRVLAVDQTAEVKDNKPVSDAKTVTLELTPEQTQILARVQLQGTLSLSLRPLEESGRAPAEAGQVAIIRGLPLDMQQERRK